MKTRLDTLWKIRTLREQTLQKELAYVADKWKALEEKITSLEAERSALLVTMQKKQREETYRLHSLYTNLLERLTLSLSEQKKSSALYAQEVAVKKAELEKAIQERKTIEKIRERQYDAWRNQIEQREGALLDETATHPPYPL